MTGILLRLRNDELGERFADRLVVPTVGLAVGTALLTRDFNRFLSLVIVDYGTGNLGSILRSAAAANVRDVYLSKHCTDAWSPKTLRAAMGAHFFLRIHENSDLIQITGKFPGSVIATSIQATKNLFETSLSGPTAFAFGNEGSGLSREMIEAAHDNMAIIMPGKTESLNVAAAAAICFFEKVRQDKATVTRSVGTKQGAGV